MHGARCLGREDELGSLEAGKLADVALWRLDGLDHAGIADPVAALVLGPRAAGGYWSSSTARSWSQDGELQDGRRGGDRPRAGGSA